MRTHRIEDYVQTITTFHFEVFNGGESSDYLYDATMEQCCNYVWKKTNGTAHFIKMTEFNLKEGTVRCYDINRVREVKNIYIQGHDEDINERAKRIREAKEEIEKFKNKHKIE